MESVTKQSSSAKWYNTKLLNDAEFYANEKKRVAEYMKNRYSTDPEYRKRIQEQKRQAYHRRKLQKLESNTVEVN